jgi:L-fucose isomerase-like protein
MITIKIALLGLSQLSFSGDKVGRFNKCAKDLKNYLRDLNTELYIYAKTVITPEDAYESLKALEYEKPDFLLVQCTSFSQGLLAQIYAKSGYPLGWWGISEKTMDEAIRFNSFCSINMYQAIVRTYFNEEQIPIKWYFGEVDDIFFKPRLEITIHSLRAIKRLNTAKVALIGGIAPGFNDLFFDERKLIRCFPGLQYNRLHEFSEIADRAKNYKESEINDIAEAIDSKAKKTVDSAKPYRLLNARFIKAYREFVKENRYDALAISCWPKFQTEFDYSVCSVVGMLNDDCIPTACEGDVYGAVSMLMLQEIAGQPSMLMDLSDFDVKDETVLMWHCGPAASNYAKEGYNLDVNYTGKLHTKECPLNCCGVTRDMVFKPGEVTIGRFAGECDQLFVAGGSFIEGNKHSHIGSRGWLGSIELANQPIGALDIINTILAYGFSHHYPIVSGKYQAVLIEIAAWLKMSLIEKCGYEPWLQIK